MSNVELETPNVHYLAKRLERDIRTRGLMSGQRYLTGVEAAHLLGVSTTTANRAMSLLVNRNVLVRQRRSGTFVGSAVEARRATKIESVYVLIAQYGDLDMLPADILIAVIRRIIGDVDVHFGFPPSLDSVAYVRRILERPLHDDDLYGVVAASCSADVYRFLADVNVPTVVMGSLYSPGDRLASVDVDNRQQAYLLVQHLISRGHRRIAVFNSSRHCPGDDYFSDGIAEGLAEGGLPPTAALMRFVPDMDSLRAQLREMLALDDRPTGIITTTLRLANAVQQIIAEAASDSLERFEIAFRDQATQPVEAAPYVHVQPKGTYEDFVALVAGMLRQMRHEHGRKGEHILMPGELRYPKSTPSKH